MRYFKSCRKLLIFALASLFFMPGLARATTFTFTGASPTNSNSWFLSTNWSPNGVPGAGDTAIINKSTPGAITVQFGGTVTVASLIISNADSTLSGGDFNNPATDGTLNVTGAFNWSGGTIQEATFNVASGAQLNIAGSFAKTIGDRASLKNAGAGKWTGTGSLVMFEEVSGSAFTNSGTFDIQTNAALDNPRFQFGVAKFINSGTLTKSAGGGVSRLNHVRFTSLGTINVNSGTIEPQGLITIGGPINVATGCFFNLANSTYRFNDGTSFNGAGKVRVFDSTNTTDGTTAIDASGIIDLTGTLDFVGVSENASALNIRTTGETLTLNGAGTFNWTGGKFVLGKLIVGSGIHWNISGAATKGIQNTNFNNAGIVTWTGTGNIASLGSIFNNNGIFNVQTDADISTFNGTMTFNNNGTLTKSASTGVTEISGGGSVIPFNNSGTVNVNSGTLELGAHGGGTQSGPFNVGAGATLQFTGDSNAQDWVFNSGTVFSGAGLVRVGFPSGGVIMRGAALVNCALQIEGRLQNQGSSTPFSLSGTGPISWTSGEINGVLNIAAGTPFNISGSDDKFLACILNNAGAVTWTGIGRIRGSSGTLNNTGTFTVNNDSAFGDIFDAATFNNSGTFIKNASTGTTNFGGTANDFSNSGTVKVLSGTLSFANNFTQTAGVTQLNGGNLSVANPLKLQGGILSGNGVVTGNIANSGGTLSPGLLTGTLSETGNYTQSAGGALRIELSGVAPGTQYDQLNVNGTVTLGGALTLSAGFAPASGNSFVIINNDGTDAVTGTFAGLPQGASVQAGNALFRVNYSGGDGNDVVLTTIKPTLAISDATIIEGDSGTRNAVFNVTLSEALSQAVTVDYSTSDNTALAPGDYVAATGTLTFSPGVTLKKIVVLVQGDTLDENDETFFVTLKNSSSAPIAQSRGVGRITDDDTAPTLSIADAPTVDEGNSGSINASFIVTLSAASGKTVSVDFDTADGTAVAPGDYGARSGTLTFAPGTTTKTITVAVKGDLLDEKAETFTVNLSNPVNATIVDGSGTGTIRDDDGPAVIINNPSSVIEGNSGTVNAIFTVTLSSPSLQTVTVQFATADYTATAGQDYTANSGTLTFAPGETSKTIAVAITGDVVIEGNEGFIVNLSAPVNCNILDGQGAVFIIDDDGAAALFYTPDDQPSE